MKCLLLAGLTGAALFAQAIPAPAPSMITPGTPAAAGPAKPEPPKYKPDTVVLSVQGKPVTAGEIESMLAGFPQQVRQSYTANPKEVVRQFMVFRYIAALGEKAKLDQESPFKEQLAFMRTQVLWQAQIKAVTDEMNRLEENVDKYYDEHKDKFTQAKVKAIYIPFVDKPAAQTDPKAKQQLTDAEAKAKAEDLVRQLRGGADFVKLVKENSEDPTSVQNNGDLPPMKKSDALPEPLKGAIFALKQGQISDPVRHTNGYYIFRGEQIGAQPLAEVKEQIRQELKGDRIREWLSKAEKDADVKFENDAFFANPPKPN